MKKAVIFFNLLLALCMSGCSSADVNNVMTSISDTLETGINNVSDFVNKLAVSKPATIFPAVPKSKYFEMDNYKFDIKYVDNAGIEVWASAVFYNKTNSRMDIIIDFPVYDLYGNIVDKAVISTSVYSGGAHTIRGWHDEYRFKKDLRLVQEQVRTRVYMNGKLIATSGNIKSSAIEQKSSAKKVQQKSVQKQQIQTSKTEAVNPASPKPRQTRQSIKK